eukprot:TRINITY_DN13828_c0_g1_i1.p1 TRINITY_DN13828_c0_g1~~TRINITY_DN13828_c0_g1_i1.p1  ORF type:complete len:260 (+),score=55.79 TRINITY_DN13828_c0_g1_i1:63-842(+)
MAASGIDWEAVISSVSVDEPVVMVDTNGLSYSMTDSQRVAHKIAVLDSSFNPPTLAHERLLKLAVESIGSLDVTLLMLGTSNADKALVGAQLHDRLAMMHQMAIAQGASPAPTVLAVTCHSLFVDKARSLLRMLSENPDSPRSTVYFIVGSDTTMRIFNPKYYKEPENELGQFFGMAHLLSFDRDEESIKKTREALATPLAQRFQERITLLKMDEPWMQDISSTRVRAALQHGEDLSQLLLPGVQEFVLKNQHMYVATS